MKPWLLGVTGLLWLTPMVLLVLIRFEGAWARTLCDHFHPVMRACWGLTLVAGALSLLRRERWWQLTVLLMGLAVFGWALFEFMRGIARYL